MAPRDLSNSAGCSCGGSCGGNCGSCSGNCSCSAKAKLSLKLEFSKAADYNRINAVFDPVYKQKIDPKNYVVKRLDSAFRTAIDSGSAVMLSDRAGAVKALTMAYHLHGSNQGGQPEHTEMGTSLSSLSGFGGAKLIVAALALREWWLHQPKGAMVAEIKNSNVPSVKTYRDALKWEPLADQALSRSIYDMADKTLADDNDKGSKSAGPADSGWYVFTDRAVAFQAQILLSFLDQGGLINKYTKDTLSVDFSALDGAGLTRPRLEAMAKGETSRTRLQQISGPGPA